MKIKFEDGYISHVPTACLIEDVQILRRAIYTNVSWTEMVGAVECVIECLSEVIERDTSSPDHAESQKVIRPSSSSLTAMCVENGIVVREDGSDILCMAGKPASEAMSGGVLQCDETSCPYYGNGCKPDKDSILLEGNIRFAYDDNGEFVLEELEQYEKADDQKEG